MNPLSNKGIISEEHKKALEEFIELAKNTTCEKPDFEFECNLTIDGEEKICHCICRTMWLMKTKAEFAGVVGIINQERNVEDKQQVFSINGVNTKEEYYKMSFAQARTMVEELKKVFDVVRFVDVETNKIISIDEKIIFILPLILVIPFGNERENVKTVLPIKQRHQNPVQQNLSMLTMNFIM